MFLGTTELITLDIADQIFGMRIVLDGVTAHEKSSQGIFEAASAQHVRKLPGRNS